MKAYKSKLVTPIGELVICADENAVVRIEFNNHVSDDELFVENEWTQKAVCQLKEYFSGERKSFELPLNLIGTEFQKKVWYALLEVSYGNISTYGKLAHDIGNDKAARAVGMALNKNPIMIVVPCHRIIGANGNLTGFAGGLKAKEILLKLEADN